MTTVAARPSEQAGLTTKSNTTTEVREMMRTKIRQSFVLNLLVLMILFVTTAVVHSGCLADRAMAQGHSTAQATEAMADGGMVSQVLQYGALGICFIMILFGFSRENRMAKRIDEKERFIEQVVVNNTLAMQNLRMALRERKCIAHDSRATEFGRTNADQISSGG